MRKISTLFLIWLLACLSFAATTAKDGNWSATDTWAGGVLPANLETIAVNHNVIYDYDNSVMANGYGAITIAAGKSITASTTQGTYYLKMAGSIVGSGAGAELRAGTADTSYPTNCTFTIYLNGNYSIDGGASNYLTCKFYCYDPPVRYLRLISTAPKAITGINKASICTVTCVGHGYSAGDTIYLVNVGGVAELNNLRVKVKTVVGVDSFTLRAYDADVVVDSTAFTTYTSGGYACPETGEAAGQTQLEIDQDVSADAEWTRAGATVNIDNVARTNDSESRTIQSVASGSVTVTAGLTAAKHSSSLVILTSRNVTLQSSATNITNGIVYRGSGHALNCAIKPGNASTGSVRSCSNVTAGGVYSNHLNLFSYMADVTLSGIATGIASVVQDNTLITISGVASGCSNVASTTSGIFLTSTGMISGCTYAIYRQQGAVVAGEIIGCGTALTQGGGAYISGIIKGCTRGISYRGNERLVAAKFIGNSLDTDSSSFTARDTLLSNAVECANYGWQNSRFYADSFDHDGVAGAFRSWTRGGITSSTETDPPAGRIRCYQSVMESATYPCWYQREINVEAGRTLYLRVWGKSDAGTTHYAQLVLPIADPLITGTGTGEWQQAMTSDGAWHEYITSWTNTASYPVTIYARFLATKASGNAYSDCQWTFDQPWMIITW